MVTKVPMATKVSMATKFQMATKVPREIKVPMATKSTNRTKCNPCGFGFICNMGLFVTDELGYSLKLALCH